MDSFPIGHCHSYGRCWIIEYFGRKVSYNYLSDFQIYINFMLVKDVNPFIPNDFKLIEKQI